MIRRIAALLVIALAASTIPARAQQQNSTISQPFTFTAAGQTSPMLVLQGQGSCSVVVDSTGGGVTIVPQSSSASPVSASSQWNTATGVGGGSITTTGTFTGPITTQTNGGLTGFRITTTALSSGTVSGTISCSTAGSGGTIAGSVTIIGPVDSQGHLQVNLCNGVSANCATISVPGASPINVLNVQGCSTCAALPVSGSLTTVLPYSSAAQQTAAAASFLGVGGVDGGGKVNGILTGTDGRLSTNLAQVGGAAVALGSAASAASVPVVIASDQTAVAVKQPDTRLAGTVVPTNATTCPTNCLILALNNATGVVEWNLAGLTASGATMIFEGSSDGGTTYFTRPRVTNTSVLATTGLATVDGSYRTNASGLTNIRVRVSVAGSSSVTVSYNESSVSSMVTPDGTINAFLTNASTSAVPITQALGTQIQASTTAGAGASITVTLAGVPSKTTYISGFELTAGPSTVAAVGNMTIVGPTTTMNYQLTEGTTNGGAIIVEYAIPIPASATNTGIVLALGAITNGGVTSLSAHGFQL
jgi:hypothetical protein